MGSDSLEDLEGEKCLCFYLALKKMAPIILKKKKKNLPNSNN